MKLVLTTPSQRKPKISHDWSHDPRTSYDGLRDPAQLVEAQISIWEQHLIENRRKWEEEKSKKILTGTY